MSKLHGTGSNSLFTITNSAYSLYHIYLFIYLFIYLL